MDAQSTPAGSKQDPVPPRQATQPKSRKQKSLRVEVEEIISEIVTKKRIVLVEKLLDIAAKQTKANRTAIGNVIDRLIAEKVIIPGSRITRKIILRNDVRKQIYALLRKKPGLNINTLKKILSLGTSVVIWHLSVLLKFECIQEVTYKNSILYSLPGISRETVLMHFISYRTLPWSILQLLKESPTALADLTTKLELDRSKIYYHLNILIELAFVQKVEQEGKFPYYEIESHACSLIDVVARYSIAVESPPVIVSNNTA